MLEAFASLAPAFSERAQRFLDSPWIDARPRPGKTSGAFSHPVSADKHPYVLLNYMGERRDVLTLAHELGHAVHQDPGGSTRHAAGGHPADAGRDRVHLR